MTGARLPRGPCREEARGADGDAIDLGEVEALEPGGDQDRFHANKYRGTTGEFHAFTTQGHVDALTAQEDKSPETVRHAEIIWHQYPLARAALFAARPELQPLTLKNTTRNEISNGSSAACVLIRHGHAFGGQDIGSPRHGKDWLDTRSLMA